MSKKLVQINEDQKVVTIKAASDIIHAGAYIKEMVENNTLSEEMRDNLCGLLDHYVAGICEPLGYNSKAKERLEAQHAEIRQLNNKIHELERQLGNAAPIDTVPKLLQNLDDSMRKWWDEIGFGWIREFFFWPHGTVDCNFGFSFNRGITWSKTPASDKEANKNNIERLKKQGFIFVIHERNHLLMDCDNNRELLINLLTERFPSIRIRFWENQSVFEGNKFVLSGIHTTIQEIHDLEGLK
jgi:hypothetical protein